MKLGRSDFKATMDVFSGAGILEKLSLILSTWFGTGLFPKGSGTVGTIAAIPFIALIHWLGGDVLVGICLVLFIPVSVWVSDISSRLLKKEDPSEVVIDEVAGMMLTMLFMPLTFNSYLAGFILFRIFDVLKPFPIGWADRRIKGGTGIVMDDLLAGLYANLSLWIMFMVME